MFPPCSLTALGEFMFDINDELRKIENTNFFSKMGISNINDDRVIFIENVEQAFVSPLDASFQGKYNKLRWLPSTTSQEDPFYKRHKNTPELLDLRKCINKKILEVTRDMNKKQFIIPPHDFSLVARDSICFCFRQLMTERYFKLGDKWEFIVELYYSGHWPIGYIENKIVVI